MDDRGNIDVPDSRPVADVLLTDPTYAVLGPRLAHPVVLGVVAAIAIILMILLGPSTDSHFIYTDF